MNADAADAANATSAAHKRVGFAFAKRHGLLVRRVHEGEAFRRLERPHLVAIEEHEPAASPCHDACRDIGRRAASKARVMAVRLPALTISAISVPA